MKTSTTHEFQPKTALVSKNLRQKSALSEGFLRPWVFAQNYLDSQGSAPKAHQEHPV
jgi:hypothetical protein